MDKTNQTSGSSNYHYNTPAIQVGNAVRDGDEFVLLTRSRQGDSFQVWSSTDQSATSQLVKQATSQAQLEPTG